MKGRKQLGLQKRVLSSIMAAVLVFTGVQFPIQSKAAEASNVKSDDERSKVALQTVKTTDGYKMSNGFFSVETGKYGQITSLQIVDDLYPTNYVMNTSNAPSQNTAVHEWMGELMFQSKLGDATAWTESQTCKSDSARKVTLEDNKVTVTYENATETGGIKDFKVVETYELVDEQLHWNITVENTNSQNLEIGDFGIPLAFNEYWSGGDEIYETRVVDHTFVGKEGSYIYVTRPSGLGQFLLMTPDADTGAGFEYQDHWRTDERGSSESSWCQDQGNWANGLNVFYIHSKAIAKTNRGYLENTSLTLAPGEKKTYGFHFSIADDEEDMKSTLYQEKMMDAVAVPGMTFSKNMPAKLYLHTPYDEEDINLSIKCPHELNLYEGNANTVNNLMTCKKTDENTKATYVETKVIDGEQYHIYDLSFEDLGQNDVVVSYDDGSKETELQFYIMDSVVDALNTHSDFMVEKTQWQEEGALYDQVFDDWMMDTKKKRGVFDGYWGWGDDWGLTHGEYIAEKNVFIPVAKEIKAVDSYLDTAVWNGLMQEHQEDYLIHDFLMEEPNTTPTYRGYAYAHIYNTFYSMYKIESKYPDMIEYTEDADTYLLRAYNILKALYSDGVAYNWETGIMGELTTPDIILSLKAEGYYEEASNIEDIMAKKYDNFKNTKYPYGSEYSYDNTGEEAVYTLAKVNLASDTANANSMMSKIDAKTRACRGLQPVWYHYANPTTICGENWWNFQYTASLAGYCMDDYLRLEDNGYTQEERAAAERVNYAAKLANLTCINSGQIDADPDNIGTVAWTYQSELGNLGGQGTGGGSLHNGWRQMAGEADLGLFGVLQILSADVAVDPVFGLFGYGCEVSETDDTYEVTPLDGLQTRLQFIDDQLYITLDRDQYTKASVQKDATGFVLQMKNLEQTAHSTKVDVTGLKTGAYGIYVDGSLTGTFMATDNITSTISVPLQAKSSCKVEVKSGASTENTAPVVNAGADKDVYLPSCDGLVDATISMDVKLNGTQSNQTRLFEFGDMDDQTLYVSFQNGNQLYVTTTNMDTKKNETLDTGVKIAADYWKNITVTLSDGNLAFYVDGQYVAGMENTGFDFRKLGEVQRNYLGRSHEESIDFFNGAISNFDMYSYGMTKEEVNKAYGNGITAELVSAEDITLITEVGKEVTFPDTITALYSDGLYQKTAVTWDSVDVTQYEKAGSFEVAGTITGSEIAVKAHVMVVEGTVTNVAPYATAAAIINTPSDLGGVAGLNDGYDPTSSRDTTHGVWHNWQGDQGAEAWVTYTWDEPVIITSQDAYYFTDGNFAPANVALYYLNSNDEWIQMTNCEGLGVELNTYNTTTFDPVSTKSIKMTMNPKTLGVGVIEWKVYGYAEEGMLDTNAIKTAIEWAKAIDESLISEGYDQMKTALSAAEEIVALGNDTTQDAIDDATDTLNEAIGNLKAKDSNIAYTAKVETSFVSGWESLAAVNDGLLPSSSKSKDVSAYGSWGNNSAYETITYRWPVDVTIQKTGLYFWDDGGGIIWPASYEFDYLDGDSWKSIDGAEGYGLEYDVTNETTLKDAISTSALRVTIHKQTADSNGLGVFEWTVSGQGYAEEEDFDLEGDPINLAPYAVADGSDDKTYDGGGLAELNDEDDALLGESASTANGFWHNWEGFGKDAWVSYTWDSEVILTGMDLYYFATWSGFETKDITLSYLNSKGKWITIKDAEGLGTSLDQWNKTTFKKPIKTTALKMVLTPKENSVGILEWKVYGYEIEELERHNTPQTMSESLEEETTEVMTEEEVPLADVITEEGETTTEETEESTEENTEAVKEAVKETVEETTTSEVESVTENNSDEESSEQENEANEVEEESIAKVIRGMVNTIFLSSNQRQVQTVNMLTKESVSSETISTENESSEAESLEKETTEEVTEQKVEEQSNQTETESVVEETSDEESSNEKVKTIESTTHEVAFTTGIAKTRLHASVMDDGYPEMKLTYQWTVKESPTDSTVTFAYATKPITDATFDKAGKYVLEISASDGVLSSSDTVTITVKEDEAVPEKLAEYTFAEDSIDQTERVVKDVNQTGYDATFAYHPNTNFTVVDEKNVIVMDGTFCGYVKLGNVLTKGKVHEEEKTDAEDPKPDDDHKDDPAQNEDGGMTNNHPENSSSNSNSDSHSSSHKSSSSKNDSTTANTTQATTTETPVVITDEQTALADGVTEETTNTTTDATSGENAAASIQNHEATSNVAGILVEETPSKTVEDANKAAEKKQEEQKESQQVEEQSETTVSEEAVPASATVKDETSTHVIWYLWILLGMVVAGSGAAGVIYYKKKYQK